MIMLISVTGNSAAPIPNRNSEAVTSADVSWNIVASKKILTLSPCSERAILY